MYSSREEQSHLLQQVLSASDLDADEERIPGEGPRPVRLRIILTEYISYLTFHKSFIFPDYT